MIEQHADEHAFVGVIQRDSKGVAHAVSGVGGPHAVVRIGNAVQVMPAHALLDIETLAWTISVTPLQGT